MDKIIQYKQIARQIIEEVLSKLEQIKAYESLLIIDEEHGQYLLMTDGWDNVERNYGPLVHIEVKPDGKVWLRYDGTDLEIGQELLDKGVYPSDLVPAFHSPAMRRYTPFAAA
jgi:hypothetical protein